MKRNIEIIIEGQRADISDDISVTLNFNSSLLSDIGQLKTNGSQTIKLPRTSTNDRIFDMALMPSYESGKTHRYLSCACYVDGVTIFDNGRCHLLGSSGDSYEIAMTWGLMHNTGDFISERKKLTELYDYPEDYVTWNANSGVSVLTGGVTQIEDSPNGESASMFYKNYYYGIDPSVIGKDRINISPCVSLLEIWERIRRENNLDLIIDDFTRNDMNSRFIVLVKNKNKALQNYTASLSVQGVPYLIAPNIYDNTNTNKRSLIFAFGGLDRENFYKDYFFKPYGDGATDVKLQQMSIYLDNGDFIAAVRARPSDYAMEIRYNGMKLDIIPDINYNERTLTYNIDRTFADIKRLEVTIKLTRWSGADDSYWYNINLHKDDFMIWGNNAVVYYQKNAKGYPLTEFRLIPNLPDIGQIDFIRFICNWYGMFPLQQEDAVRFVPLSRFDDNIDNGKVYDWSDRLVSRSDDAPQKLEYSLGYARNNAIGYTDDEVQDVSYIKIDDNTLEPHGEMMIFPFAASHKNVINQYSVNGEGELEENDIQYRIMGLSDSGSLNFNDDMTSSYILSTKYRILQNMLKKPKVIEEEIMLTMIDLQQLDYTKPVYLKKYGRYFAIDTIRWFSNKKTSNVKLILIR